MAKEGMVCAHGVCSASAVNAGLGRVGKVLVFVVQNVLDSVDDSSTNLYK